MFPSELALAIDLLPSDELKDAAATRLVVREKVEGGWVKLDCSFISVKKTHAYQ